MINILKNNYKAIIQGGLITLVLTVILYRSGMILINSSTVSPLTHVLINTLTIAGCWGIITFLTHKYSIYRVLGILSLLLVAIVAERYMKTPDNPITIPVIIMFWLGTAYLIIPTFFKKYRIAILSIYAIVLFYFLFFRSMADYAENYRRTFNNMLLMPIPVFFSLWLYEQWRWVVTMKADKAKAELALLKSQVNPHFFFNTLNNLYGLVVEKSDEAPEVVINLSEMMRYTIYEGKEDLVSLKDEITYLENYIDLHKIRYQKSVEISFNHDIGHDMKVAPLLFINLLENAFKHGVQKMTEHAFVHMKMTTTDAQLIFEIKNNFDVTAVNEKSGIGLENLKQRLSHSYPKKHKLIITSKEDIYNVQLTIDLK